MNQKIFFWTLASFFALTAPINLSHAQDGFKLKNLNQKYVYCFDTVGLVLDAFTSNKLAMLVLDTADVRQRAIMELDDTSFWDSDYAFDTAVVNFKSRIMSKQDQQKASSILTEIVDLVYANADTLISNARSVKTYRKFKIDISGEGLNLIAPSKDDPILHVSKDIVTSILNASLKDCFINLELMDYFDFSDTDATTSPALFLAYLNEMLSKKFPCVPYISAQEVFRIIN